MIGFPLMGRNTLLTWYPIRAPWPAPKITATTRFEVAFPLTIFHLCAYAKRAPSAIEQFLYRPGAFCLQYALHKRLSLGRRRIANNLLDRIEGGRFHAQLIDAQP